ncbi:MAG: outer membrane beta-barrel protein [Salibacteraceae bacterium]
MMKSIYTTLFISFLFNTSILAQKTDRDTTSADSSDVEVVITPKKDQDSTIVKVAGMKIIVLSDNKKSETLIIDEEEGDTTKVDDDDDDPVSHWAGIRIGVNGFLHNNGLPLPTQDQPLELNYGKSVSWDINLFEKDFMLYKQHIELVTGLGMHFANYTFKSEYTTLVNTDPFSYAVDSTKVLTKNKLKATYITAPLMLGFSTHKDENKAFRFAFGGQVSWRIGSRLKQEYSENGSVFKPRIKSDFDLTPFLFHGVASIGYGPMNVYASYGLNPLFESGKTTADLIPFDIGLQLMF